LATGAITLGSSIPRSRKRCSADPAAWAGARRGAATDAVTAKASTDRRPRPRILSTPGLSALRTLRPVPWPIKAARGLRAALASRPASGHDGRVSRRQILITPELMLRAYRAGLFPMAESRGGDRLYWLDPERRGVLPLRGGFHLPRRLLRTVLSDAFEVTADADFAGVIAGCAAPGPGREDTWINPEIERLFLALHAQGHAHSIEVRRDGELAGGLYGVVLGGAFFGESMFSRARDASKVALVHLVARLRLGGFVLLDTQFLTPHLSQFGAHEISRADYKRRLNAATGIAAAWPAAPGPAVLEAELRAMRPDGAAR
jgi:leucyl/phenylalanyl-tRNA---protein transferase